MQGHLVYFSPLDTTLRFWEEERLSERRLSIGEEVRMEFEPERSCVGYNDGEKMHRCPGRESGVKQCRACAARDISKVYTRLDPTGFEGYYEKFRNQEFSVYLAAFAHLVKCGVTRHSRLMDRLREQGADYFCELARANDAETAYCIESMVQSAFPIRNAVTSIQKLRLLGTDAGPDRLSECLKEVRASGMVSGYEGKMEVAKLDYPVPAVFSEANSVIEGKIRGNKGQLLFFEKDGSHFAINMSRKTGSFFF